MKMHYFNLFLLHFTIESELPRGPDGITSLIAGAVRMQPAIWRTYVQCANSEEDRAITRQKRKVKKKKRR